MALARVLLDGETLSLEALRDVTRGAPVELAPAAVDRVTQARALVDRLASGDAPIYGINTGFGTLAEVKIAKSDLQQLQRNLILSHAAGVGSPLPIPEARALMALRANVLAKGYSGIRPSTLQLLVECINRGLVPVVPERGSVGASGDLAPLAHLALVLIGEGEAFVEGQRMSGRAALEKIGLKPIVLEAKEGLALVNGTQAMCAVGIPALLRAEELAELADLAGAMTLEGLLGSHKPFMPEIHQLRGQSGQAQCAAHLREILVGSEIVKSHENCAKVQDPYSLRCMPQVHGAARDGLSFVRGILSREANAATDNPLVFVQSEQIVSGGNFHGQPVSLALDVLAMSVTQLASISERRVEQLVNPALSGLPPFLTVKTGLNSGFMIAQVTAAALVVESRILCHPACVDSIPSSAGREDHVSMGMTAALKARSVVDHVRTVLAIEVLVAAQALDLRRPMLAGKGVQRAYELVRSRVPSMVEDRELHKDMATVAGLFDSGELLAAARG
ncbi:MAG: histidine ammonia-lyase [Deltaproteobacteria bacterium]|nr:histidine ammonia-lyase [Deltaproteobacteria bacterium]